MVAQVSPIHGCTNCSVKDSTAPAAPQVRVALASAGLSDAKAPFYPNQPPAPPVVGRDPAYLELGNWEPGTKIQIINKTNDPTASFDNAGDVVTLDPTGRDIDQRIASVWLTQKQMDKINLDSGDSIWIRLVDDDGNASPAVKTRLQGSNYGQQGRVQENNTLLPASRLRLLDGEAQWKNNMVLKHIADSKAPEVKAFEAKLRFETGENGQVTLIGDGLLEEGARVSVQNGSSGQQFQGVANADQQLRMAFGAAVKDGDTLFVTVRDLNNNAAGKFEVRYGANCKDGRAATKGILGAKLSAVIKPGE
jgi:hypothetical protein